MVTCAVLLTLNSLVPHISYLILAVKGTIAVAVAGAVFLATFPREDRDLVLIPAARLFAQATRR
jgi:hypothetical protein